MRQTDRKKTGSTPVYIQYCFNSEERAQLPTGFSVPIKFWNASTECIIEALQSSFGDRVRNMKNHLQCFEKFRGIPITFENMDLTFYESFVEFLIYDYVGAREKILWG